MAKIKETYICSSCGAQSFQWKGQCPACQEWNTLEVTNIKVPPKGTKNKQSPLSKNIPIPLQDVCLENHKSFGSGLDALDRILGNGFVPGAAILVGGEPGIGKSTLLLQLAGSVASGIAHYQLAEKLSSNTLNKNNVNIQENLNSKTSNLSFESSENDNNTAKKTNETHLVLYASGEESLAQIKSRAERLNVLHENLLAIATTRVQDIIEIIEKNPPDLLIVDSIQTLASDYADGLPGNVGQVKACATELVEVCKKHATSLVLVGHVTKDGDLAGPRLLEHLVDTVISLEGDRRQVFRILRVLKNRFGPNQELLVFQMRQQGLEVVEDPSTFFLGARDPSLSGTAVVMAVDGQRTFAVEIQALVSKTYLAIPRRTGLGFDVNRLHLLLAVLEKRLRLNFGQVDIYAKVSGGMKLQEPGLDLALVAAILSSFYDIPLPERAVFWGEVDLNGQVRPVSAHELREKQAKRLGYKPIFCPCSEETSDTKAKLKSSPLFNVKTVAELQARLFRRD